MGGGVLKGGNGGKWIVMQIDNESYTHTYRDVYKNMKKKREWRWRRRRSVSWKLQASLATMQTEACAWTGEWVIQFIVMKCPSIEMNLYIDASSKSHAEWLFMPKHMGEQQSLLNNEKIFIVFNFRMLYNCGVCVCVCMFATISMYGCVWVCVSVSVCK